MSKGPTLTGDTCISATKRRYITGMGSAHTQKFRRVGICLQHEAKRLQQDWSNL